MIDLRFMVYPAWHAENENQIWMQQFHPIWQFLFLDACYYTSHEHVIPDGFHLNGGFA